MQASDRASWFETRFALLTMRVKFRNERRTYFRTSGAIVSISLVQIPPE